MGKTTMTRVSGALLWAALAGMPHAFAETAASAAAGQHRTITDDAVDTLVRWTREDFTLSPTMAVDSDTRRRIEALIAGFAERQRPRYEGWVREWIDTPAGRENPSRILGESMGPRYLAVLADWRLRGGGAAHEAALRQAAALPASCHASIDADTRLDEVAALVQATPQSQRDAFMEGERQLLARWGDAPPVVASGGEDVGRDVARWAQALRRGDPHDTLPMAPLLAGQMLAEPPEPTGSTGRCSARQWWVTNRLQQSPEATEAIWQAWRLEFARRLMDNSEKKLPYPDAGGSAEYPAYAMRLGLEGSVFVRVERDARGRYRWGTVTKRELASRALPGRAVPMFEDQLDSASLARARKLTNQQAGAAAPGASAAAAGSSTIQFVWKMED